MASEASSLKRPHEDDGPSSPSKKAHLANSNDSHGSSRCAESGASQFESAEIPDQDALLRFELGGATHQSASLCQELGPDPHNRATAILDELRQNGTYQLSTTDATISISGWPDRDKLSLRKGVSQTSCYSSLVSLLNAIIDAFKHLFPDTESYYVSQGIRFNVYDKEIAESVDCAAGLNPTFIASAKGPFGGVEYSWNDVEIPGVVGNIWRRMVVQSGSYARCLFAATNNRIFVPVLTFNTTKSEFRICFFYRGGLLATTCMNILRRDGFESFVSAITGMLNWEDAAAAGYCPLQSRSHFVINNQPYQMVQLFCRRNAVRGRGTRVFGLMREPQALEQLRPQSARLEGTAEFKDVPLPDSLVVKCSFPLASRVREDLVFQPVKQYIGVVDVLGAEDAPCITPPSDATYWGIWASVGPRDGQPMPEPEPELRLHRHLFLNTVGRPLRTATGPRELGSAILHAMIGHFALFSLAGYVHRDVSNGNILLLESLEERLIPPGIADIVTSKDCIAVLSDGDVAKKWGEPSEPSTHRSGTKPFISRRITDLWQSVIAQPVLHTPIDDLESFIWVLYFTLLEREIDVNSEGPNRWKQFTSDNLSDVSDVKTSLLYNWVVDDVGSSELSLTSQPFFDLFRAWFITASHFATRLRALLNNPSFDAIKTLCIEAYRRYIREGGEHIPKLPEHWVESP